MRESRERARKRRETSGKSGAPQKARERKAEETKEKSGLLPPFSSGCIRHRFQITEKRIGIPRCLRIPDLYPDFLMRSV